MVLAAESFPQNLLGIFSNVLDSSNLIRWTTLQEVRFNLANTCIPSLTYLHAQSCAQFRLLAVINGTLSALVTGLVKSVVISCRRQLLT